MQNKQIHDEDYIRFRDFLERRCGIVLGENKQYLVRSRLSPLMRKHGYLHLSEVVDQVVNGRCKGLVDEVVDAMTTNETLWFRDGYPFELLMKEVFPRYRNRSVPLTIWCAACSSGQEPYSLAMTVNEYQRSNPGAFPAGVRILGTDISAEMLNRCRVGSYDSLSLSRGLSEERKRRFFDSMGDGVLAVKDNVKHMVSFRSLNLLDPFTTLGKFDIVFCRNVLIYFSTEMKSIILKRLVAVLKPQGTLFLGASESISGLSDDCNLTRCAAGLYYSKRE